MSDDLTDRITAALDNRPHLFQKPIPGQWRCAFCFDYSPSDDEGMPELAGQQCRHAPGPGKVIRPLLAEAARRLDPGDIDEATIAELVQVWSKLAETVAQHDDGSDFDDTWRVRYQLTADLLAQAFLDPLCPSCGDNGDCGETGFECGHEFHGNGEH